MCHKNGKILSIKNYQVSYIKTTFGRNLVHNLHGQFSGFHSFFILNSSRLLHFLAWHNIANCRLKVASCLNFKVPEVWEILVAEFLDSKSKIKKRNRFQALQTHGKKNSFYNAAFFRITLTQDLAFDNCYYEN